MAELSVEFPAGMGSKLNWGLKHGTAEFSENEPEHLGVELIRAFPYTSSPEPTAIPQLREIVLDSTLESSISLPSTANRILRHRLDSTPP
jgi:hypothetical protein